MHWSQQISTVKDSGIQQCTLCPRACAAQRNAEEGRGFCAAPSTAYVAKAMLHMWEEPPISGTRGAGTIFFSGCTLRCVYCQNRDISRIEGRPRGRAVTAAQLADIMLSLEEQGAHNIEFVTGTQFVPTIIEALELHRPAVPVVWNSGGYERIETVDTLAPYVDIWLPDYKYALSSPAEKYSGAPDYPEVALRAIERMREHAPENVIEDGIMRRGVIVRHLVLPLNVRNSIAALERLHERLPDVPVSIMGQYTPVDGLENYPELTRRITPREYGKVCDAAQELGIEGYVQELSSAESRYIPQWDE